jgi:hypothetical protein
VGRAGSTPPGRQQQKGAMFHVKPDDDEPLDADLAEIVAEAIYQVEARTVRVSGDLIRAVAQAVQDAGFRR